MAFVIESDFPPGTEFWLGPYGLPITISPEGKFFSWCGATANELKLGQFTKDGFDVRENLVKVDFELFAKTVDKTIGDTDEVRTKNEARAISLIKQESDAVSARVRRYLAYDRLLAIENQPILESTLNVLFALWKTGEDSSIFPLGTRYFVKGEDVPVAVVAKYKGSSWYGGTETQWDNDHLMFAMHESKEPFDEVSFEVFARVVAQSVGSSIDKDKLFEEEIAPILARLKADRALAARTPTVGLDDYMYSRPDVYGIWRDSDGDPI